MTTVDNQLQLLISLYEEEKVRLQKLIDEYQLQIKNLEDTRKQI